MIILIDILLEKNVKTVSLGSSLTPRVWDKNHKRLMQTEKKRPLFSWKSDRQLISIIIMCSESSIFAFYGTGAQFPDFRIGLRWMGRFDWAVITVMWFSFNNLSLN